MRLSARGTKAATPTLSDLPPAVAVGLQAMTVVAARGETWRNGLNPSWVRPLRTRCAARALPSTTLRGDGKASLPLTAPSLSARPACRALLAFSPSITVASEPCHPKVLSTAAFSRYCMSSGYFIAVQECLPARVACTRWDPEVASGHAFRGEDSIAGQLQHLPLQGSSSADYEDRRTAGRVPALCVYWN